MPTIKSPGSAGTWGPLWSSRAEDWASIEEQQMPTYEEALRHVGPVAGRAVLDVGCGAGVFLRMAADRGALPFGLDASDGLIGFAAARVPEAELRVGEMEAMPYDDDSFDLVTGFSSFFFAADLVAALREAGRVAKPGAQVLIHVWGAPERNDLEPMKRVARSYAPAPPPDAAAPPPLWERAVLEGVAGEAGLIPEQWFTTSCVYEYADDETLGRVMMAPMGLASLVGPEREDDVRREIVEALAPYRAADGRYRLNNEFHHLIARV